MAFEVTFEADNGRKFTFGQNGGNYYGMNIGGGLDVALGTSQGFSQIGETVQTQGVSGRVIDVTGEFYGDIAARKNALRSVCPPMTAGRLVFQKLYFIRVYVKTAPTFSAKRGNGWFKMQFFAPFPYYSSMTEKAYSIGAVTKEFHFPVNYSTPHRFGTRSAAKVTNVYNDGDVQVPFRVDIRATSACSNVTVTNLNTLAFLKLTGDLSAGDRVAVYRDSDGVLRAELTSGGVTTDILGRVDDDSTLFELAAGDNLLAAADDNGGVGMVVQFTFYPARAAMYEDQSV